MTGHDFAEITRREPEWSLVEPRRKTGGRNNLGRMTMRHIGGGHKQHYRVIDFKRDKDGIPARVASIEYDPNRSARIALLHYRDGEKRYIIAPVGCGVGDEVMSGTGSDIKPGNAMSLGQIPLGTIVHNVELRARKGSTARPQRGCRHPTDGQRGRARAPQDALRRVAARADRMPGHRRTGRQSRSRERLHRQGRPHALAREALQRPRRGNESRRPSTWWRRGPVEGQSSADPLGRTYQGIQDSAQQAHATRTSSRGEGASKGRGRSQWHARSRKARSSTAIS